MERHDEGMPCAARAVPYSVRHAVLYMRHAMHRRLTAAEVANAAGVPERSLHRHFLHFLGQAPLVHFKTMRLAAARTALLASGAENATVTDIATQFGFVHLGRFSLDYRLRFGESPSATLARARAAATESRERARARPACPAIRRPVPALVVMPIRTAAAGMQERLFAEGLAEKLASALAQAHGFSVRPARAEPDLKSQPPSAHYCLVGQISRLSEHRIRAVLRLLDLSRDGRHLWGDAFDGSMDDLISFERQTLHAASSAVRPGIEAAEIEVARRRPPQSLEARDLVLRAMPFVLATDAVSARRALEMLDVAMHLDPDDPAPVALASWCCMQLVLHHETDNPVAARAAALALANRSAVLDPLGDPLTLTGRGCVATWAGQPVVADALLARALAIDPCFGWAWERSACVHANYGRADRAVAAYRRAMALKGPRASLANCAAGMGYAHLCAGRHEAAARWMGRALAENPGASWLHFTLVPCLLALDEEQAARSSIDRLRRVYPGMTAQRAVATLPGPLQPIWTQRLDRFVALGLPA